MAIARFTRSAALSAAIGAVVATAAAPAHAQEATPTPSSQGPVLAPRPWLYLDDPSLPAPMRVVALVRGTYTNDPSPTRPFGANVSRPGGIVEAGAEVGLLPKLSLAASGFGGGDQLGFGALAGLRYEPFGDAWKSTHMVFSGGYLRELNGGNGAWMRFAIAQDIQRLRLGATAHGEHVFQDGRDAVDLLVMAGVSYRVLGPMRLGVEYVGQDVEGALSPDNEEGVRHFLGPQVALELLDRRLSVAGGPALGLGPSSPPFSGRLSVAYEY
jgi:hypothetical protein